MIDRPEIVLIAAIARKNRVIGKNGEIPWHISEDLKRFKRLTIGHSVIMGRKTFESILKRLGKPLPERLNVVLTSSKKFSDYPDVKTFRSLKSALKFLSKERRISIIGGESVYKKTLLLADRLELTMVDGDYNGDAFFPEYEHLLEDRFLEVAKEKKDGYEFLTYQRMPE